MHDSGLSESPYPGLRPFRRDEADIFFGREEQVDQLLTKLETCRFLAVVGVSGCGKSSLVRAGMLSALESGFMASAGPRWHVVEMRPGGHPLANLAQALLKGESLSDEWTQRPDADAFVRAVLRRGPLGLVELMRESLQPKRNNLLLLVDQFEEIFRFHKHGDAGEATAFIDLLLASAEQADVPIYVVITMRSDFLGDCSIFSGLPEAINDGQFLIPRLSREQCRAAILGPAAAFGADVEPELVNHILNDIGSDPDQLPLMQHALMRVWNRGVADAPADDDGDVSLTLAEYESVGGVKNALSNHADELFEGLSPDDQRVAETLFRCLSERGANGRDIRRPIPLQSAADAAQTTPETVARIVEVFRDPTCSFLTPPHGVELTPDRVLDISHESLIRQWSRMTNWVAAEGESASIYRRLSETAALWNAERAALWVTPDLENALAWREREQPNAAWAERYGGSFEESMAFLDASVEAHDRQQEQEQQRQERERQLLQEKADAEKRRADDQAAANARLRGRAIAAFSAGALAVILAIAAFVLFANARNERDRADAAREDAVASSAKAKESADKEAAARKQAEAARYQALTQTLAAYQNLGRANVAQLQSLWNAGEPGRQEKALKLLKETGELRKKSHQLYPKLGDDPGNWRTNTRRTWRQLASPLRAQAVRWMSYTSLQPFRQLEYQFSSSYSTYYWFQFALSPAGDRMLGYIPNADKSYGGELQIIDTLTGNVLARSRIEESEQRLPWAVGFTGDGKTVLIATQSVRNSKLEISRHSAADLKRMQIVQLNRDGIAGFYSYRSSNHVWFDPDGRRFIFSGRMTGRGNQRYATVAWNATNGEQILFERGLQAVFSPKVRDRILVYGSNKARMVSLADGKTLREYPRLSFNNGDDAVVSPDGKWLATPSSSYRYLSGSRYEWPLSIVNLENGQTVSTVGLSMGSSSGSSSAKPHLAFHPQRPILTALNRDFVWLISVPQGGILHQARIDDTPEANRRFYAHHIEFSRDGNELLTVLRDSTSYSSRSQRKPIVRVQLWDPSVATAAMQTLSMPGIVSDFQFAGEDALAIAGGDRSRAAVQLRPLQGRNQWSTATSSPGGGFDPSGKHYVHVLSDTANIIDAASGKTLKTIDRRWPGYNSALPYATKNHRWLLGVDRDGPKPRLRVFDATTLKWFGSLVGKGEAPSQVYFDDDGGFVRIYLERRSSFGSSVRYVTSIFRAGDGKKLLEFDKYVGYARSTKAGYLIVSYTDKNGMVYDAYDLKTGKKAAQARSQYTGYSISSRYFTVSDDGRSAVFAGVERDGSHFKVHVWPFADGKPARALPERYYYYYEFDVAYLTKDRLCFSARLPRQAGERNVRRVAQLWYLKTYKKRHQKRGANRQYIVVSRRYSRAIVHTRSRTSRKALLWNLKTGERSAPFEPGDGYPTMLSPDERFAYFNSGSVFDFSTQRMLPVGRKSGTSFHSSGFSSNSRYLPIRRGNGDDRKLTVHDLHQPEKSWTIDFPDSSGLRYVLGPNSKLLATCDGKSARVELWELAGGKRIRSIDLRHGSYRSDIDNAGALQAMAFSPNGRHLMLRRFNQVRLANVDSKTIHTALPRTGHSAPVTAVAVSPDRKIVASASQDGTVCFWNAKDGRYRGMLEDGRSKLDRVTFSPRGGLIATRSNNHEVVVWKWSVPKDDPDGEITARFLWSNRRQRGGPIAFSPDGRQLAVANDIGSVRIYDAIRGRIVHWLARRGPEVPVRALAYSPDGRQIAAARGGAIGLWNLQDDKAARTWNARQGPIHKLAFPADGRFLVSTGQDVRLWNPADGTLQLALDRQSTGVKNIAVSDSGKRLALATDDRSVVITNAADLLKSLQSLGLNWSDDDHTKKTGKHPRDIRLWVSARPERIEIENTLAEFESKAVAAERNRNWKDAVTYLSRLLKVRPKREPFLKRRFKANIRLSRWDAAAEDFSRMLDLLPAGQQRQSKRSELLATLLRENSKVFPALLKLRPKDPLPRIALARDAIARSEWKEAYEAFSKVIRSSEPTEAWYEYAGVCLLSGNTDAYNKHVKWMADQQQALNDSFMVYVFTRAGSIAPRSAIEPKQAVAWGERAVAAENHAWFLHACALAHLRAGNLEKCRERIEASRRKRWGAQVLNDLLLAMLEHRSANYKEAKDRLDRAKSWRNGILNRQRDGYVSVQFPDWIEFNVLLREADQLLSHRPPVAAPTPFPPGGTAVVTAKSAELISAGKPVAVAKQGERLPVIASVNGRVQTFVLRDGVAVKGWIESEHIRLVRSKAPE